MPTLLLWGNDDRRSPMHVAEQLRDAIPAAELAIIPKAGHISNMEQPDAFNGHVRRFCLESAGAFRGDPDHTASRGGGPRESPE